MNQSVSRWTNQSVQEEPQQQHFAKVQKCSLQLATATMNVNSIIFEHLPSPDGLKIAMSHNAMDSSVIYQENARTKDTSWLID